MIRNVVVFTSVAMCCGSLALADSNSKSLRPLLEASTPVAFNRPSTAVDLYIDQTKVAFRSTEVAGDFLNLAMEQFASLRAPDKKAAGDAYYIIHLLRWKDPQQAADPSNPAAETGFSLNVDAQNWYVYHRGTWSTEDFSSRNRLYGAKTIYLLYVELNVPASASIRPIYTLNYVEKTADNVNHLLSLLSLFLPSSATGGASKLAEAPPRILWGAGNFENIKAPSDVTVSVAFEPAPTRQDASLAGAPGESDSNPDNAGGGPNVPPPAQQAFNVAAANPVTQAASKSDTSAVNASPSFDNEGRYWWDVSVAVPLHKISQTTIDTSAGTISPKQVDKLAAFAALDLYPWRVDTKRQVNYLVPHFVGGVSIASQPLHKILLAAGFGPPFANFYIGAVLVKQPQVPGGSTLLAGPTVGSSFSPQLAFGINLQVKAFQNSLSKSK